MELHGLRKSQRQLLPCNDVFIVWFPKTVTYREILYNSPYWPSNVDDFLKMSYTKGSNVNLKISGENICGLVIWRGITSKVKAATTAIESLIEQANDTAQLTETLLTTNFDIHAVQGCTKRVLVTSSSSSESDNDSVIIQQERKRRENYLQQTPVNISSPIFTTGRRSSDDHMSHTFNILPEFTSTSCKYKQHDKVFSSLSTTSDNQPASANTIIFTTGRRSSDDHMSHTFNVLPEFTSTSRKHDKQHDKVLSSLLTTSDNQPASTTTTSSKIENSDNITEVSKEILSYMKIVVKEVRNVSVQVKKLRTEFNREGSSKLKAVQLQNNNAADDTMFEDFNGNQFSLSCLYTIIEPNKFALKFIQKLSGPNFLKHHILEPNSETKSKRHTAPAHIVANIKKALDVRFLNYDWQNIKKYLNQKGRDLKKTSSTESAAKQPFQVVW